MGKKTFEPIIFKDSWSKDLEKELRIAIYENIFLPLIEETEDIKINAKETALEKALKDGVVQYQRSTFKGEISAAISKEIKKLGGKWVKGHWMLIEPLMPDHLKRAISSNKIFTKNLADNLMKKFDGMIKKTSNFIKNMTLESMGGENLNRVSREFKRTVGNNLAVKPELDVTGRYNLEKDYLTTVDLPIRKKLLKEFDKDTKESLQNFAQETVEKLRKDLFDKILDGRPRQEIRDFIKSRLKISDQRCKFIASQETRLLTSMFKEQQYTRYGVTSYQWVTVGDHKVRDTHKDHNHQIFDYENPPVVSDPGQPIRRANPGIDFNCRCIDKPIVEW